MVHANSVTPLEEEVGHRGILLELSARIVVVWILSCCQVKHEIELFGYGVVNSLRICEIGIYE